MKNSRNPPSPNKTDAGNGSYGICRVIDASRSPSPDPKRSANPHRYAANHLAFRLLVDHRPFGGHRGSPLFCRAGGIVPLFRGPYIRGLAFAPENTPDNRTR